MTAPISQSAVPTQLTPLPEHWQRKRLRYLSTKPIKNGLGEAADHDDPNYPRYIRITDIAGPRHLYSETFCSLPPKIASEALVDKDDILISAVGATYGKSFYAKELDKDACFAGYLVRLSPAPETDPSFLAYWTESCDYWAQVDANVIQATIQNFSAAKVRHLNAPLPSLDTQQQIARFLDDKTARIDGLIEKKRELLKCLAEKRQALITRAVTKGIDPDAPMKPSGVDWLGDIPAYWEVKRLGYISQILLGLTYSPGNVVDEEDGTLVIRASNIQNGRLVRGKDVFVNLDIPKEIVSRLGDIIVCSRNGSRKLIGKNAQITEKWMECTFGAFMTTIRTELSDWVRWVLASTLFEFQSGRYMTTTVNQLTISTLKNFPIPIPTKHHASKISQELEQLCTLIDTQKELISKSIKNLSEYRTALITAAVTGQLPELQ